MRQHHRPRRHRWTGPVIAVCSLAVAAGCSSSGSSPPPPPTSLGTIADIPLPATVRDAPLLDANGKLTSLSAFRGKIVVLADFLTLCQEICPLTSANFARMAATVDSAGVSDQIEFVELTVDPARDSPARLAAYRKMFSAQPNWTLLTGTPAAIATIWKQFGVDYESTPVTQPSPPDWWTGKKLSYDMAHTDAVIFIDAAGRERFVINAAPDTNGHAPPSVLSRFLNAQGRRNLTRPGPIAWTTTQALQVTSWLAGTHIADERGSGST